jgi:eukaryotic-like serine/threonine-protein kinase
MSNSEDTKKLSRDATVGEPITHVAGLDHSADRSSEFTPSSKSAPLRTVSVRPAVPSASDDTNLNVPAAAAPRETNKDPYLGSLVDERYQIEEVIGEGGMGIVYLCKHKVIGKRVAMKVLRADMARDREVTRRFLNEARSASAIGNPHIIDISDFGQFPDGSTYFVMEYLDGVPLTRVIVSNQPIPIHRIVHIALQLAEALAAAHDAGIVHRDLKPDNIFLVSRGNEKEFVKILDFGIAKVPSAEGRLTRVGAVFGTPHYMSPEQATGTTVDHRGDIYSLGVILYEMASGRVPFDADNFMGILTQHMYKAPVPIRALVPLIQDIPPGLEAIILKCLSKRPEHRYQSMRELADELVRVEQGLTPKALPELRATGGGFNVPADYYNQAFPAGTGAAPWSVRARWPLYVGLSGAMVAAAATVVGFSNRAVERLPTVVSDVKDVPVYAPTTAAPLSTSSSSSGEQQTLHQVLVEMKPTDAHAFIDGKDIGPSPAVIAVPEASTVTVEVQRQDYRSETVIVDGQQSPISVELVKKGVHVPKAIVRDRPKSANDSLSGGEITDPWKHKTSPR